MPDTPTPQERLIVALDFENQDAALRLVDTLGDSVSFYKVGLELFVAAGPAMVQALRERGKQVFLDLKMDDVPETISRAVARVAGMGAQLMTIHGGAATARAANAAKGDTLKTLQITLLTSMGEDDLREWGLVGPGLRFDTVDAYVGWRAENAIANGCDGLISSGQNVPMLRERLGEKPLLVCPGIRFADAGKQDHKRPATPYNTILDGADYLVVGRPIRDAAAPADAAHRVVDEITRALRDR